MFAPVIHTFGAISSVRNVLCVYLWLQNPPDQGRLIFMGSANRDFVFRELKAAKQTHDSHMHMPRDIHTRERGGGGSYGRLHTVQPIHKNTHARAEATRTHTHKHPLQC